MNFVKEQEAQKDKIRVDALIDNKHFTLVADDTEGETYILELAQYINKKLNAIRALKRERNPETEKILIAINIADELFKESERLKKTEEVCNNYSEQINRLQSENIALKENFEKTESESKEREEYVERLNAEIERLTKELEKIRKENDNLLKELDEEEKVISFK